MFRDAKAIYKDLYSVNPGGKYHYVNLDLLDLISIE